MKETSVDKFARIHDKLEKTSKPFRFVQVLNNVFAYGSLAVVLLTGGLFIHERLTPVSSMLEVETITTTKSEYEDGDSIQFYVVYEAFSDTEASIETTIRCDAHDGKGVYFVGSDTQALSGLYESTPQTLASAKVLRESVGETASFNVRANGIRSLVSPTDQSPITYKGAMPEGVVNSCYGDHTITSKTPIFGLPISISKQSYPFEYVWYQYFDGDDQ